MKRKRVITYWWKVTGFRVVPYDIQDDLEEATWERITEMQAKGFTSGELHTIITKQMPDSTEIDLVCYGGFKIEDLK